MTRAVIQQRLTAILVEELGIDAIEATPDARVVHDLGADSLDCVDLIMAAEEVFDIDLWGEEEEVETDLEDATVSQVVDYIAKAIDAKVATT